MVKLKNINKSIKYSLWRNLIDGQKGEQKALKKLRENTK